jgi:putative hydrolase of the HAD superfamily
MCASELDSGPRALLLDALGTLVALDPPAPLLRAELARRFGIEIDPADAQRAIAAEIKYYRAHLDEGRDAPSLAALRRNSAEALRDALPPAAQRIDGQDLTEALLTSLRFRAFADAKPAIEAARASGLRVVVVSNWDVSLPEVLARVGLAPLLDGVVTSAQVGARKPSPTIFASALALAGVAPERAVHVGDSPAEDVDGARAAGIEPILISRQSRPAPHGVRTIASLAQIASLL